jgi:hypothetical protein
MADVDKLPAENVRVDWHSRSVTVLITATTGSDGKQQQHRLVLTPLAHEIDVSGSSHVAKKGKLTLRLRKVDASKHWFELLSNKPVSDDD